ncbi:MAG: hypothetical protein Q8936_01040 [Bacillota bacterium]|nr:hypothetical protein [Bacillota bacterium]
MYVTSISLSYIFLGITIITIAFSIYFKTLVAKTSPGRKTRDKIIGDMKDPMSWRDKNNRMGNISIFWSLLSLALFIYFKFFYITGLVYSIYLYIYIAAIALTLLATGLRKKVTE